MSKTTLEEGALDSIKLPRSDTPSSIDGTNIITDKTVTAVSATTGNIDQNKVDHSNNTPAEMTIETQVVKKKSRFTVKTIPNEVCLTVLYCIIVTTICSNKVLL